MNHVKAILSLFWVIPTAVALFFYNLAKKNPKKLIPNETPILLIHGYIYRSGGWSYIHYHLKKAGYQNIYTLNLGSPLQSIDDYALKVKQLIEQIGSKEIILIGHSMGGLIAVYYDHTYAQPGSIKQVITLGSPLEGTEMGVLGLGDCAKEMRVGSNLLKNLSEYVSSTPYLHMGSKTDLLIRPWESALFYSSHSSHVQRQIFNSIGHLQLLFSKRIVDVLVAQLANNSINP